MYLATYNPLYAAGWSLVLYHTLSRLFSMPQPDSLLAKASAALLFVRVPSLLPVPLAALHLRLHDLQRSWPDDRPCAAWARTQLAPNDLHASLKLALLRLVHRCALLLRVCPCP